MERIRGETTEGCGGALQCGPEGCKFGPESIVICTIADGEAPPADCVLQLRLRAGDAEDTGGSNLFDRPEPTDVGEEVFKHARASYLLEGRYIDQLRSRGSSRIGRIHIRDGEDD